MVSAEQPPAYRIASVDHALRLLLLLKDRPSIRVREAAEELGVAQSTAHRLLTMLVYRGFARQNDGSHVYEPGPELVETGITALTQLDIRQKAHPFLLRLAAVTGETASLQVSDGKDARFIDSVESSQPVRVGSRVGDSRSGHASSGGKVLLSELPAEQLERILDSIEPEVLALRKGGRAGFEAELARVREQGYAVNHLETRDDVIAVAVPVRDRGGRAIAALSIAGPLSRMSDGRHLDHVPALLEAARDLERQLYA
ncbi:IclR family transcriptional regulator [Microbacterium sp. NPDC096154]|uniref:IclR family transcriptional regulator n=1 Tax=Microbacterium sp. NPDC096154 TaxID=3155549 RepID=UPI003330CC98